MLLIRKHFTSRKYVEKDVCLIISISYNFSFFLSYIKLALIKFVLRLLSHKPDRYPVILNNTRMHVLNSCQQARCQRIINIFLYGVMKFLSHTCRVTEFLQNQPRACQRVMKTSVKSSVLPCNVNRSLLAQFVNSRRLDGSTNYPLHLTESISDDILAKIIIVYKRILPKVVKSFNLLD